MDFQKFWASLAFFDFIASIIQDNACWWSIMTTYTEIMSWAAKDMGLPSCKTRLVHFIMLFWYSYFRNYLHQTCTIQIKPALSSIFCLYEVHTALWYNHISQVRENYELYCYWQTYRYVFARWWLYTYILKKTRKR